jgi:hypothetical protein
MIKLLQFLTQLLKKEQLYELAMFLSDHPDIIDQETLLHIVNEVNGWQNRPEYKDMEEHFKKMDDAANKAIDRILENDIALSFNIESSMNYSDFIDQKRKGEEEILKKLLGDNNISLN